MLCIEVLRLKRAVINIVVAGDFAAVVSVEFNNLREIVIDGIELKVLFPAPVHCFCECLSGAAGPEYQLIAISSPFLEIGNQRLIGLTAVWPFTVTESAIEIYGNRLKTGDNLLILSTPTQ